MLTAHARRRSPLSQQYAKDLEQARRAGNAAAQRASGLEAQAASLAEQNAELLLSNLSLTEAKTTLEGQTNELALVNRRLTAQVRWEQQQRHAAAGE